MRVSILSSRDTDPNVVFALSFNVTFGPASLVFCRYKDETILNDKRDFPTLSREVIRSQYVDSSQPDMTRVILKVERSKTQTGTYACLVTVEGRVNIHSSGYTHDTKGSRDTEVVVTGEWLTAILSNNKIIVSLLLFSVASTPTGVTAIRTGYTSVLVTWTPPSPSPAGYEVFYQTSAGDSSRLSGGNTSNTELTLTGLTLGETYSVFVVAFGEEGAPVLPSSHSNTAMSMLCKFISNITHFSNNIIKNNVPFNY